MNIERIKDLAESIKDAKGVKREPQIAEWVWLVTEALFPEPGEFGFIPGLEAETDGWSPDTQSTEGKK